MSTARLTEILKQLIQNGFKAGIFSLKDGLPLATEASPGVNDKMLAAFSALASDTADRARDDLNLSNLESIRIVYANACILCRNIVTSNSSYLIGVLSDKPESDEVSKYYEQLLDWACENSKPILEKLSSL
jgi:predicted regulator of Ras-like GTPase activity (Roadblock/LC7/MglB family)